MTILLTVRVNVPSNSAKNSLKLSFVILLIFILFEITLEQLGKQIVIVSSLIKFYRIDIRWLSIGIEWLNSNWLKHTKHMYMQDIL